MARKAVVGKNRPDVLAEPDFPRLAHADEQEQPGEDGSKAAPLGWWRDHT